MATLSHLSSVHTSTSSLRPYAAHSSGNSPKLSFNSQSRPFSSISLKPHSLTRPKPRALVVALALKTLSETDLVVVPEDSDQVSGQFPQETGVYAVFDSNGDLQFIGLSRNIAASVLFHRKSVPELCHSAKVGVVDDPDRTALTQAWKSWMEEHIKATGKVPPGNESGNATWVRQAPRKKADLRLTPGRNVQLMIPMEELIDRMVKENKVVVFIKGSRSAPLCGFSQRVIGILDSQGVEYESVDVLDEEHNFGLRETLKSFGRIIAFLSKENNLGVQPTSAVGVFLLSRSEILASRLDAFEFFFHSKIF